MKKKLVNFLVTFLFVFLTLLLIVFTVRLINIKSNKFLNENILLLPQTETKVLGCTVVGAKTISGIDLYYFTFNEKVLYDKSLVYLPHKAYFCSYADLYVAPLWITVGDSQQDLALRYKILVFTSLGLLIIGFNIVFAVNSSKQKKNVKKSKPVPNQAKPKQVQTKEVTKTTDKVETDADKSDFIL